MITLESFLGNTVESVSDRMNFKDSPFETIIGNIAPLAMLSVSWPLGIILFVAESFGFGLGRIGRLVDKTIGFSGKGLKPVISLNGLYDAASKIINKIISSIGGLFSTSGLNRNITKADMKKVENLCIIASYDPNFIKLGLFSKRRLRDKRYLAELFGSMVGSKKNGGKTGLIRRLASMLFKILGGIAAFGIIGGVVKTVSGKTKEVDVPSLQIPGATGKSVEVSENVPKSWLYYNNAKNDIQDSIIYYLNYEISGFSNTFFKENGIQIYNSPQMRNLLKLIEKHNSAPVTHLNNKKGFVAPKIEQMAEKIMPGYKYPKKDKPQTKSEE